MPRAIPSRIKANFANYKRFISSAKTAAQARITMSRDGAKKTYVGKTAVVYLALQGDKRFEAEVSIDNKEHYFFRLFVDCFDEGPCFRFDSQGRPHCNPEDGRGLKKRQVLTPHFHKFDEDKSVEIAYQTPILRGEECRSIVGDYNRGLEHFCQEASLSCTPSGLPVLEIEQGELDLSNIDPQNGVSF